MKHPMGGAPEPDKNKNYRRGEAINQDKNP
jgi:hypothetical protein